MQQRKLAVVTAALAGISMALPAAAGITVYMVKTANM